MLVGAGFFGAPRAWLDVKPPNAVLDDPGATETAGALNVVDTRDTRPVGPPRGKVAAREN